VTTHERQVRLGPGGGTERRERLWVALRRKLVQARLHAVGVAGGEGLHLCRHARVDRQLFRAPHRLAHHRRHGLRRGLHRGSCARWPCCAGGASRPSDAQRGRGCAGWPRLLRLRHRWGIINHLQQLRLNLRRHICHHRLRAGLPRFPHTSRQNHPPDAANHVTAGESRPAAA
jgi:hypothetical protein